MGSSLVLISVMANCFADVAQPCSEGRCFLCLGLRLKHPWPDDWLMIITYFFFKKKDFSSEHSLLLQMRPKRLSRGVRKALGLRSQCLGTRETSGVSHIRHLWHGLSCPAVSPVGLSPLPTGPSTLSNP